MDTAVPSVRAAADAAAAHGAEAAAAAGGAGFPQLDPSTYASQVFWLAVAFAVLYALMSRLALPRVGAVIEARRERRQGNLDRAQRSSDEAARIRQSYEASLAKAQGEAQDALRAAEQDTAEKMHAASAKSAAEARARVAEAEQRIEKARQQALSSLADISAELAADMAQAVAGVQVQKDAARKTVAALMGRE